MVTIRVPAIIYNLQVTAADEANPDQDWLIRVGLIGGLSSVKLSTKMWATQPGSFSLNLNRKTGTPELFPWLRRLCGAKCVENLTRHDWPMLQLIVIMPSFLAAVAMRSGPPFGQCQLLSHQAVRRSLTASICKFCIFFACITCPWQVSNLVACTLFWGSFQTF